jgi:hypothetical protein
MAAAGTPGFWSNGFGRWFGRHWLRNTWRGSAGIAERIGVAVFYLGGPVALIWNSIASESAKSWLDRNGWWLGVALLAIVAFIATVRTCREAYRLALQHQIQAERLRRELDAARFAQPDPLMQIVRSLRAKRLSPDGWDSAKELDIVEATDLVGHYLSSWVGYWSLCEAFSRKGMAMSAGLAASSVRRYVDALKATGLLEIEHDPKDPRFRWTELGERFFTSVANKDHLGQAKD